MSFHAVNRLHQALSASPFAATVALNTAASVHALYHAHTLRQLATVLADQDKALGTQMGTIVNHTRFKTSSDEFKTAWDDYVGLIEQGPAPETPTTAQVTNLTLTRLSFLAMRDIPPRSVDFEIPRHQEDHTMLRGNTLLEAIQQKLAFPDTRYKWMTQVLAGTTPGRAVSDQGLALMMEAQKIQVFLGRVPKDDPHFRVRLSRDGSLVVVTLECPDTLKVLSEPIVQHLLRAGLLTYLCRPQPVTRPHATTVSRYDIEKIHIIDKEIESYTKLIRVLKSEGYVKLSEAILKTIQTEKGITPQTLIDAAYEISKINELLGLHLLFTAMKASLEATEGSPHVAVKAFIETLQTSNSSSYAGKLAPVPIQVLHQTIMRTSISNPDRRQWFLKGLASLGIINREKILDQPPVSMSKRRAVNIRISRVPGTFFKLHPRGMRGASLLTIDIGIPHSVDYLSEEQLKILVCVTLATMAFNKDDPDALLANELDEKSLALPATILKPAANIELSDEHLIQTGLHHLAQEQRADVLSTIRMFQESSCLTAPFSGIPNAGHIFRPLTRYYVVALRVYITVDERILEPLVYATSRDHRITLRIQCASKDLAKIDSRALISAVLKSLDGTSGHMPFRLLEPLINPDAVNALVALEILQAYLASPVTLPERIKINGSEVTKDVRKNLGLAMMALHDFSRYTDSPLLKDLSAGMLVVQLYHVQTWVTKDETTTITALPTDRGIFIQIMGSEQSISPRQWLYLLTAMADNPGKAVSIRIEGTDIHLVFGEHHAGHDLYANIISDVRLLRFEVFDPNAKRPRVSPKFPGNKPAHANPNFMKHSEAERRAFIRALIWFAYAPIPDEFKPTATDTMGEIKKKRRAMSFAYHPDNAPSKDNIELFTTANSFWDTVEDMNE
ncbi:MAG: hypothetical protein HQM16_02505 [Deltaproteobacteria bacterium]|nr:hypothetical protein [Deltaproteobacteria bacterium]